MNFAPTRRLQPIGSQLEDTDEEVSVKENNHSDSEDSNEKLKEQLQSFHQPPLTQREDDDEDSDSEVIVTSAWGRPRHVEAMMGNKPMSTQETVHVLMTMGIKTEAQAELACQNLLEQNKQASAAKIPTPPLPRQPPSQPQVVLPVPQQQSNQQTR